MAATHRPIVLKTGTESPDPLTGLEYPIPDCLNHLEKVADVIVVADEREATILDAIDGVSVLMTTYGEVTRRVIEAGKPTLKGIVKLGTGIDSIDVDAAKALGVRVVNCPNYAGSAVAENAFLLMINCFRKFIPINRAVRTQGWTAALEELKGWELNGKLVGLVGLGHINRQFARMCQGFDMKIQAYDPHIQEDVMAERGIEWIHDLDRLMESSDVVAVCLPLNDQTRSIISEHRLTKMKPGAFLINVSRGACVDETALLRLLKAGRIGGCGLDVFSDEPLRKDSHLLSELLAMDNVVVTPHLAAWTHDTWQRLQAEIIEHVVDILEGRDSIIRSSDPRLQNQSGCLYRGD